MGLLWYALQVKPRFEKVVARNLQSKGYEEFLPTYSSRRSWADRIKIVENPLFPGYVFSRFDASDRLPVLTIPGVNSVVSVARVPRPVDESELDAIRMVVRAGVPCSPWPFLRVGERVELVRGPLRGLEGLILDLKNSCRLIVSLNLLMRSVAVEVDRDWICPILPAERYRVHREQVLVAPPKPQSALANRATNHESSSTSG